MAKAPRLKAIGGALRRRVHRRQGVVQNNAAGRSSYFRGHPTPDTLRILTTGNRRHKKILFNGAIAALKPA
jgi:hypothetical protein